MRVFTRTETFHLMKAMAILKETERNSRLRRLISSDTSNNPDVDLEDLGIFRESVHRAGDAVFNALITAGIYMKDEQVDKRIDEWQESKDANKETSIQA